ELNQYRETFAEILVAEAEELLDQQQMSGRGYRNELGQSLDDSENNRLDDIQGHVELRGRKKGLGVRPIRLRSCRIACRDLWRKAGILATTKGTRRTGCSRRRFAYKR